MTQDITLAVSKEVSVYERVAEKLVLESAEDMVGAVKMLSETNKVADRVKEEKEKVTKPLLEALNAERARWKPIETAVANAVALIRGKMMDYQKKTEEENRIKEEKLMARVEKGTMRVDTAVTKMNQLPDAKASVTTDSGMVQWTTVKKLVITDEGLIPREYLVIDQVKVKEALKKGVVVSGAQLVEEKVPKNFR
jgi:hypothetical protein